MMNDEGERMPWEPFNDTRSSQFSKIYINPYRRLRGISLHDLRRINFIVGVNNAGKTSVLEAIHLLSHQNDETALLDVMRWRGRWEGPPDPDWLAAEIPNDIFITGYFDQVENNVAMVDIQCKDDTEDDLVSGQGGPLPRWYSIESRYGHSAQSTDLTLSSDRPYRTHHSGHHWLFPCSLTGPFGANRKDALVKANGALDAGIKTKVVNFIKTNIDSANTELLDQECRCLTTHPDLGQAIDLSTFGDGLRRVFEIGLLLASVRGGVLLIDEFESSLHPQLLKSLARIVQELATKLNVQVFLTTHSKEALDAFITNNHRLDDIAAYALQHGRQGVDVRRFDGNQLLLLHEAADFDLRGVT